MLECKLRDFDLLFKVLFATYESCLWQRYLMSHCALNDIQTNTYENQIT